MLRLRVLILGHWRLSITRRESTQALKLSISLVTELRSLGCLIQQCARLNEAIPWRGSLSLRDTKAFTGRLYIPRYPVSSCDHNGMHLA